MLRQTCKNRKETETGKICREPGKPAALETCLEPDPGGIILAILCHVSTLLVDQILQRGVFLWLAQPEAENPDGGTLHNSPWALEFRRELEKNSLQRSTAIRGPWGNLCNSFLEPEGGWRSATGSRIGRSGEETEHFKVVWKRIVIFGSEWK